MHVLEPQHRPPTRFQIACPALVIGTLVDLVVRVAVKLDSKLQIHFREVEDERRHGVLTAELQAVIAPTKFPPQFGLGVGLATAKLARTVPSDASRAPLACAPIRRFAAPSPSGGRLGVWALPHNPSQKVL